MVLGGILYGVFQDEVEVQVRSRGWANWGKYGNCIDKKHHNLAAVAAIYLRPSNGLVIRLDRLKVID